MPLKDTQANSAGMGWAEGSVKGATTGFTVGGPWGALIGAALGGTRGMITGAVKHNKRSDAQNAVDAMEANRLQQLTQARRSIEAGTDAGTMNAKAENARLNRSTQNVIARNSGGNVAATVNGFLRAQSNAQGNVNQIEANSRQQLPFYMNAEGELTQRMAQRKLELSLLKQNQQNAQSAQDAKERNVNANALISTLGSQIGGDKSQEGGEGNTMGNFFSNIFNIRKS